MSKDLESGIVIVGSGGVYVTMLTDKKDGVVVVEKQPTPYKAPIPPQMDYIPYWDGKSARNNRREAERNAKKKRK